MSDPLVSVVVAVKNGERFLAAAIDSILQQDYRPLEIIVVDGNSTDRTAEIARSYNQVRYVKQVKPGLSEGYNLGVDSAAGELVAFLSHDDLWTPDKLRLQVQALQADPELQYAVAKTTFFLEPGYGIPPGFRPELLQGERVAYIMETLLARKPLFAVVGRFDPLLGPGEDVDWFARAKDMNIPHAVVPKVLLHKRVHDANFSLQSTDHNLLLSLRRSIERKRHQEAATDKKPGS